MDVTPSQSQRTSLIGCVDGRACADVVEPYVNATTLHRVGEHVLAAQYEATGDATAARHGLWDQLEQDVTR